MKTIERSYKITVDESKKLSKLLTEEEYQRLKEMNRQRFELQFEFDDLYDIQVKELLFKMYKTGYLKLTIESKKLTIPNQYEISSQNLKDLEVEKKVLDAKIKKYKELQKQAREKARKLFE